MKERAFVLAAGFLLDLFLGDPHTFPHPVRWMGSFIGKREKALRKRYPKTKEGELAAGVNLAADVLFATGFAVFSVRVIAGAVHKKLRLVLDTFMCYQMLAAKSLLTESMKVYEELVHGSLESGRKAVSMIVGRDTWSLSKEGVIRAAVETVAENTSDGVIAPMFYMAMGGVPLMYVYKAVNTMDSMVGYRNETYEYIGKCGAKLDDLMNLVPSRIGALLMIICSRPLGFDAESAWKVFWRDRHNHKSPNSAQTEAACAGALGVRLAGDAWYFGVLHKKPFIGDDKRPVEAEDIKRANRLMLGAAGVMVSLCTLGLLGLEGKTGIRRLLWRKH